MDAPLFLETKMAASSVTGTGPGESFGKQKPELHSSCGCGFPSKPAPAPTRRRTGCAIRRSAPSGAVRYSAGSNPARTGSCI